MLDIDTCLNFEQHIIDLLIDEQLEVRHSACLTLSALVHSNFMDCDQNFIDYLKKLSKISKSKKDKEATSVSKMSQERLNKKHGGVLGLCALVNASPYDIPNYLPDIVAFLCQFINQSSPIQV